jgi:hypothetical protein
MKNTIWNIIKPILKTLGTILISVIFHILTTKLYNYYCIGEGWISIVHTMLYMPSPQCRIILDMIKYTSDLYILFWTTIISGFILNYKIVKKGLTTINNNIKYFKNI